MGRHLDVGQDEVDLLAPRNVETGLAIPCGDDGVARPLQDRTLQLADRERVVDDEDPPRARRRQCSSDGWTHLRTSRPLDEPSRIQHEQHGSVRLGARADEGVEPRQQRAQPLDHDVPLPEQFVDLEGVPARHASHDERRSRAPRHSTERCGEVAHGDELVPDPTHRAAVQALVPSRRRQRYLERVHWHGVPHSTRRHEQTAQHGEGHGHRDGDLGVAAALGPQIDPAADGGDVRPYRVHADAPA